MRLFEAEGFSAVSIGRIAAAAGVSVPTFYAHYPSKERVVLIVPPLDAVTAVFAGQPADLPTSERLRRGYVAWFSRLTPEQWDDLYARWKIIAGDPDLRLLAAESERRIAVAMLRALAEPSGRPATRADEVIVLAYLSAYTAALFTWVDSGRSIDLVETIDAAVRALAMTHGPEAVLEH